MSDLALKVSVKFKGRLYDESKIISFLKAEGYGNIRIGDADIPDTQKDTSIKRLNRIIVKRL